MNVPDRTCLFTSWELFESPALPKNFLQLFFTHFTLINLPTSGLIQSTVEKWAALLAKTSISHVWSETALMQKRAEVVSRWTALAKWGSWISKVEKQKHSKWNLDLICVDFRDSLMFEHCVKCVLRVVWCSQIQSGFKLHQNVCASQLGALASLLYTTGRWRCTVHANMQSQVQA